MPVKTYYETLGVADDASAEQIRKAYNKASLETHPDRAEMRNPGVSGDELDAIKKADEERFKEGNAAYNALKDPSVRASYDASLKGLPPTATEMPKAIMPSTGPSDKDTMAEENTADAADAADDADADADTAAGAGAGARNQKMFESKPQQPTQNPLMDMWNRMVAEIEALYGKVFKMIFSNESDAGAAYPGGKKNETKDGPLSDASDNNERDKEAPSADSTSAIENSPSPNQRAASQSAPLSDTPGIRPSPDSSSAMLSIKGLDAGYDEATATKPAAPAATTDPEATPSNPPNLNQ